MSYNCYLFGILMPETPAKLSMKIKGKNSTVTLLSGAEINFLKYPGLTEITLPLTFPMLTGHSKPDYYIGLLEKAKTERTTTQFILTRTTPGGQLLYDTNMKVSIEDYNITEDAKNGLDVSVEVQMKQYVDFSTKVVAVSNDADGNSADTVVVTQERSATTAPKASTYTVQTGDTLWTVAAKYLGDGSKYGLIYEANKDKVSNPNLIFAGQVLTIPSA